MQTRYSFAMGALAGVLLGIGVGRVWTHPEGGGAPSAGEPSGPAATPGPGKPPAGRAETALPERVRSMYEADNARLRSALAKLDKQVRTLQQQAKPGTLAGFGLNPDEYDASDEDLVSDDFTPSAGVAGFLALTDAEQVALQSLLTEEARAASERQAQRAVITASDDEHVAFHIPALAADREQRAAAFAERVKTLLGEEKAARLQALAGARFRYLLNDYGASERTVEFWLDEGGDGDGPFCLVVDKFHENPFMTRERELVASVVPREYVPFSFKLPAAYLRFFPGR